MYIYYICIHKYVHVNQNPLGIDASHRGGKPENHEFPRQSGWSSDKKSWCCSNQGRGCPGSSWVEHVMMLGGSEI